MSPRKCLLFAVQTYLQGILRPDFSRFFSAARRCSSMRTVVAGSLFAVTLLAFSMLRDGFDTIGRNNVNCDREPSTFRFDIHFPLQSRASSWITSSSLVI